MKQADSEFCPPHLPSGRRQQTAANPEAWRELQARCLGRLGHTARSRVPGLYLGLLRLRPGSGTGLPQHEGGTQGHGRSLRPLTHLRLGTPRERPRPAQASAALAITLIPANPRRAVGVAFTFESRAGPSIFRLLGLTWVGLRRGRGGARTGRKPVLARLETRKTPAEPAAGAAAAEAAGAAASRPPASPSRLASGGEGTQPPTPGLSRCSVAPGT